jgi:predicted GH43/DUF377 family glycosyl hydrolase
MKTHLLKLFLLITFLVLSSDFSFSQVSWTKNPDNPVFPAGPFGSWYRHVFMPCVIYNADSLRYEMWFGAGYSYDRPYQIGFATSEDGISWAVHPDPVLIPTPGSWDSYTVEWPWVIREYGEYKMWYGGGSIMYGEKIGYATSPDGINWTKYADNPVFEAGADDWEAAAVGMLCIMPFGGEYKMWYTGVSTEIEFCIGYATSTDGILWQRATINNPVLEPGPGQWDDSGIYAPRLLFIDGIYYMWYTGDDGVKRQIGLATSPDGIFNWAKHAANPVLSPSPGTWDSENIEGGSVLLVDDTLFYWYNGCGYPGGNFLWQIGLATSGPFTPVSVEQYKTQPTEFALEQNYPNPFNPSTNIEFRIVGFGFVSLKVYDILGREVVTLVNEERPAGIYEVEWNAKDFISGVYLYQIKTGSFVETKKMLLLK